MICFLFSLVLKVKSESTGLLLPDHLRFHEPVLWSTWHHCQPQVWQQLMINLRVIISQLHKPRTVYLVSCFKPNARKKILKDFVSSRVRLVCFFFPLLFFVVVVGGGVCPSWSQIPGSERSSGLSLPSSWDCSMCHWIWLGLGFSCVFTLILMNLSFKN